MNGSQIQATLDPNTYQELEALRGKLWSLQETFSTHITYLKEPKYPFTWPDLLNKFNMLTAKFASLSEDFYGYTVTGSSSTLPKLMLHPYIPTTTEQETNILSVLLRTKLIPAIEKLEAETQAAIAQELLDPRAHQQVGNIDDEQRIQNQLREWTELRNRHDRVAIDAARFVQDLVSDHRSNFLLRYEDQINDESESESENDEEGEEAASAKEKAEWEKAGFPSEEIWKKWRLECMMNFYSSGKNEVIGSDLKKLAVNKN